MNNRLKILHLTASLSIGGAERLILDLVERTNQTHFETHVCALGQFDENSFLPDLKKLKAPLHIIPANHFYSPRTLLAVIRYLRRQDIDIVHTHLTDADIVGRLAGWLTKTPVISTLHNTPHNYDKQRFDRRWLVRATARYLKPHLVGVSNHIRDLFVKEWCIPKNRISAILNAVPVERFLSVPEGTNGNTAVSNPTIINIASLTPQKAQHLLLEAASLVLAQRPDTQFLLVGIGELEQPLKAKAHSLGISNQVVFTGLRRDIPALLGQSDLFVLSSLWEGLPISAIEAMAAARPLVLTDVGGNSELIESGAQGLLVPPGDVAALAQAILTLLNDAPRRLEMGRLAREEALAAFSFEPFTKAYEALYQTIADKNQLPIDTRKKPRDLQTDLQRENSA